MCHPTTIISAHIAGVCFFRLCALAFLHSGHRPSWTKVALFGLSTEYAPHFLSARPQIRYEIAEKSSQVHFVFKATEISIEIKMEIAVAKVVAVGLT